jgi:hypothetical protein
MAEKIFPEFFRAQFRAEDWLSSVGITRTRTPRAAEVKFAARFQPHYSHATSAALAGAACALEKHRIFSAKICIFPVVVTGLRCVICQTRNSRHASRARRASIVRHGHQSDFGVRPITGISS